MAENDFLTDLKTVLIGDIAADNNLMCLSKGSAARKV